MPCLSKINVIYGKLQIDFLIGRGLAAKFTPEGLGQGWIINHDIIGAICTDHGETLFGAIVNTSRQQNRLCRFCPKVQCYTWRLISVNIYHHRQSREKLHGLYRMHARVPAMFSIQETKSWCVLNLALRAYVCYGSKSGFATLLVSKKFCTT